MNLVTALWAGVASAVSYRYNVTVTARATYGACLEVKVTMSSVEGTWTPPYTEVALVLPPGDTRSFLGGASAPMVRDRF